MTINAFTNSRGIVTSSCGTMNNLLRGAIVTGSILFINTICSLPLFALELTKLNGEVYKDATIIKRTPSGLEILHSRGGSYLPFCDLPDDIKKKFNYSEEADKAYQQKLEKRKAARIAKLNKRLAASTLERGKIHELSFKKTTYFVYIPESAKVHHPTGLPLTVIVHDTNSDAHRYLGYFVDEAEEYGTALIAPLFDDEEFRHYQFIYYEGLDIEKEIRGRFRSDLRLNDILDDFSKANPYLNIKKFSMYGFSGGAQFTMRYSLLYPYKIKKAAVVSPGSYMFPDSTQEFPRGIKYTRGYPRSNYPAFLKLDILFCIGKNDTGELNGLKSSLDYSFQGKNRYIRHKRFWSAVKNYAHKKKISLQSEFYVEDFASHQRFPFHAKVSQFLFDYPNEFNQ